MKEYEDPERRKAAVRILFITIFLDLLGFGIMIPQAPYFATKCGLGGTMIGIIGGSYSLLQLVMSPVWGKVSDRIGRRPVILIGLIGSGLSYLVFGAALRLSAATGVAAWIYLLASRAVGGLFNANIAAAQAFVADVTPGRDRTAAMGVVGAAIALGFVLGPAISAGIYAATASAELPFYFASAAEFACLAWALRALPESHSAGEVTDTDTGHVPITGRLVLVLTAGALATTAMAGMENTLGLFVMDSPDLRYDSKQFAYVVLYLGLVIVLTQAVAVKRLSARLPETRLLLIGALAMVLGLSLTPRIASTLTLYALMGSLCFGYGLISPCLSSLNARLAPPDARGQALGLGQSMTSLGRIIGPVLGGWLYQNVSHGMPYLVGAGLALLCAAVAVVLHGQLPPADEPLPDA